MNLLCSSLAAFMFLDSHHQAFVGECQTEPYPDNCHFPFSYKGTRYTECTTVDNWGVPWCSTDPGGDGDCLTCSWANCQQSQACVFPTTYQGLRYDVCIFLDNDGYPWCNTTGGGWGNCDKTKCPIAWENQPLFSATRKGLNNPTQTKEFGPIGGWYYQEDGGYY